MVIKVSPRAATAAFGTWHAKSRSSGKDLNYQKLDVPRLQQRAWESFTSKAATKDDNLMGSSFSPSSCAAIPHSWNSTHGALEMEVGCFGLCLLVACCFVFVSGLLVVLFILVFYLGLVVLFYGFFFDFFGLQFVVGWFILRLLCSVFWLVSLWGFWLVLW